MTTNHAPHDKLDLTLSGVPETLLWPLCFRVAEARRDPEFFSDPLAEEITRRIKYDFSKFGRTNAAHAIRSKFSDDLIKEFLARHPVSTVVALGEGLETQLWRTDNGHVNWVSIDLPEVIEIRRRLLPSHPRNQILACSAFDPAWLSIVNTTRPVFVTAAGLFMYFEREDVLRLLRTIAVRLPGAHIFFDTIPPWLSKRTQRGWRPTSRYQTPRMPFGIKLGAIAKLVSDVPGLKLCRVVGYHEAYPHKLRFWETLCAWPGMRQRAPGLVHAKVESATD